MVLGVSHLLIQFTRRWGGEERRGGGERLGDGSRHGLCCVRSVSKEVVHCLEVGQDSELNHQRCIKKEKKKES